MSFELSFLFFPITLVVALLVAASSSMPKPPAERGARYKGPWNTISRSSDLLQPALIDADAVGSSRVAAAGMQ